MTLQTLFELASAFDTALIVKFVDFPTFIRETKDLGTGAMQANSFDERAFSSFTASANSTFIRLSAGALIHSLALESTSNIPAGVLTKATTATPERAFHA